MKFKKKNRILFLLILLTTTIFLVTLFGISIEIQKKGRLWVKTWLGRYHQKSIAYLQLKDNDLEISFQIEDADKEKLDRLITDFKIGENWQKGIVLSLDSQSKQFLTELLPVKLDLTFSDGSMNFTTPAIFTLNSSLSGEKYEYATGSGKLTLDKKSERDFNIKIYSPGDLLKGATESGKLHLSSKLFNIFPILDRIDKIDITVQNKNINGKVEYK